MNSAHRIATDSPCQCGWTDPRNGVNWHVRSFDDHQQGLITVFRRPAEPEEYSFKNWFGRRCDRLEDHELAQLLDLAIKSTRG